MGPWIFGPKRYVDPAVDLNEIPEVNLFLLTHNHYDHFDIWSLKKLSKLNPETIFMVPAGDQKRLIKAGVKNAGFDYKDGESAIVPIMLYDAKLAQQMANELLKEGIYVIGFFFPVVPKEHARIRVQLSAAHSSEQIDAAIAAFTKVGKSMGVI